MTDPTPFVRDVLDRYRAGFGGVKIRLLDAGDEIWALREIAKFAEAIADEEAPTFPFHLWDCNRGTMRVVEGRQHLDASEKKETLSSVLTRSYAAPLILLDPEPWLDDAGTMRALKNALARNRTEPWAFLIIISTDPEPIADLDVVTYPVPDRAQTERLIRDVLRHWDVPDVPDPETLIGLTAAAQENALALSILASPDAKAVNTEVLRRRKEAEFARLPHLRVVEPEKTFDDLAGVGGLRRWVRLRGPALRRDTDLPTPRGMLLAGPPGTGKSRIAEAVAGEWSLPLVSLDIGAVFGRYIGESEERISQALDVAERLAPCVLLVDEVERAFGTGAERDGGTAARVTGKFLSWLASKTAPVFVVFTSNAPTTLPPAMIRKGRLDEIFFVGLPDAETRRRIFALYLPPGADVDIDAAVERTEGWSPAEIEAAVLDARFDRDNFSQALDEALTRTSLYASMPEALDEMIAWARRHGKVTT